MITRARGLTRREAQALLWTAEGKTAWDAGRILGVTESTAAAHIRSAAGKLRASNRAHLVARAFVAGILARRICPLVLAAALALALTGSENDNAIRLCRRARQREAAIPMEQAHRAAA